MNVLEIKLTKMEVWAVMTALEKAHRDEDTPKQDRTAVRWVHDRILAAMKEVVAKQTEPVCRHCDIVP